MSNQKRCPNYTPEERETLLALVEKYKAIINNKRTGTVHVIKKNEAWCKITAEFNAMATTPRETVKLKHFYDNLKHRARKVVATAHKEVMKTGGGSYQPVPDDQNYRVLAALGTQLAPDQNPYDDAAVYFGDVMIEVNSEQDDLSSTINNEVPIILEERDESPEPSTSTALNHVAAVQTVSQQVDCEQEVDCELDLSVRNDAAAACLVDSQKGPAKIRKKKTVRKLNKINKTKSGDALKKIYFKKKIQNSIKENKYQLTRTRLLLQQHKLHQEEHALKMKILNIQLANLEK